MDEMAMTLEQLYSEREIWFTVIEWIGIFFIGIALVELCWDIITKTGRKTSETFANLMVAAGNEFTGLFINAVILGITYYFVQPFALFSFEMSPTHWAAAILLADFLYYWMHRAEHEIRVLWAYHVVHHSSTEFDLTTGYRLSWIEGLIEWVFLVPMLLLGFDAITTFAAISVVVVYQTWIHTQKIGTLGKLEGIISTPSAHRVHHGSNDKYLDKNYGGILMIWDRIFGTYQPEEETVAFGITTPIKSINPFVINFHEYAAIIRDCISAQNGAQRIKYIFAHPGWKPTKPKKSAVISEQEK